MCKINVLMVGVGPNRVGGMWTVAENYIKCEDFNDSVNLRYVATSTNGSFFVRFLYMIWGYIKIRRILITEHIDIVHIHMAEKGSTFRKGLVAKWAKKRGKKVMIHLHAGPFMSWYQKVSEKNKSRIRQILGYADRVAVLGTFWKKELSEIIPNEKIVVLYNGVDCPRCNPYNSDARNIVYFGVMKKEKGIYDLIEAISQINNKLASDIKVILCGNDLEGNVAETIGKVGLKDRIRLVGWVSGQQKEVIYKDAMISILPSYYEGLSMTILEAMARGIPVITTNISTMPEVIGNEERLVEPGNVGGLAQEILLMSENKTQRISISCEEFERVNSTFSKRVFIENTLDIYRKLVIIT